MANRKQRDAAEINANAQMNAEEAAAKDAPKKGPTEKQKNLGRIKAGRIRKSVQQTRGASATSRTQEMNAGIASRETADLARLLDHHALLISNKHNDAIAKLKARPEHADNPEIQNLPLMTTEEARRIAAGQPMPSRTVQPVAPKRSRPRKAGVPAGHERIIAVGRAGQVAEQDQGSEAAETTARRNQEQVLRATAHFPMQVNEFKCPSCNLVQSERMQYKANAPKLQAKINKNGPVCSDCGPSIEKNLARK